MGDEISLITRAKQTLKFFKVSSSAINFEVKLHVEAVIGITKNPAVDCQFWIFIGNGTKSYIKNKDGDVVVGRLPEMNINQFYKYWVTWSDNNVSLGQYGNIIPLIKFKTEDMVDLKYVTFSTSHKDESPGVHWKFEVPPPFITPKVKPIDKLKLKWVTVDTQLPDNAFIGGYEEEIIYIIRAEREGSMLPGIFVPSKGAGFVAWNGRIIEVNEFEVLCGFDCIWVKAEKEKFPLSAVEAGYSKIHKEMLYIGRISHCGHIIPGKIVKSHKLCYVPFRNEEISFKKFEILVVPGKNLNTFFIEPYPYLEMKPCDDFRRHANFHPSDEEDDDVIHSFSPSNHKFLWQ